MTKDDFLNASSVNMHVTMVNISLDTKNTVDGRACVSMMTDGDNDCNAFLCLQSHQFYGSEVTVSVLPASRG